MKPWMQKSGIGLSGRIPVTTERKKSVAGNLAAEGPVTSTDSPIPERWRKSYDKCKQWFEEHTHLGSNDPDMIDHCLRLRLIEELGTAESRVRDLAQYAQHKPACRVMVWGDGVCTCGFDVALYRIPAHLRAPETTSKELPK